MPATVRIGVQAVVTPMRHDATTGRGAGGVSVMILHACEVTRGLPIPVDEEGEGPGQGRSEPPRLGRRTDRGRERSRRRAVS
jgi:hypothetical protein